jgi:hypothetical protein
MITAIVTVKTTRERHVFDAIGRSTAEIEQSVRESYEEPVGITVLVVAQ